MAGNSPKHPRMPELLQALEEARANNDTERMQQIVDVIDEINTATETGELKPEGKESAFGINPMYVVPAAAGIGAAIPKEISTGIGTLQNKMLPEVRDTSKFASPVEVGQDYLTRTAPTVSSTGPVQNYANSQAVGGQGYYGVGPNTGEHDYKRALNQQQIARDIETRFPGMVVQPGERGLVLPQSVSIEQQLAEKERALQEAAFRQSEAARLGDVRAQRLGKLKDTGKIPVNAMRAEINKLPTTRWERVGGAGNVGMGAFNTVDAINQAAKGNVGQSAISGVGAVGSALGMSPNKKLRYIGRGLNYLAPAANSAIEEKAAGGIAGYSKGKIVQAGLDALKKPNAAGKSGARLAREAAYVHDVVPTHQFGEAPKVSIQDLQGKVLVGVPGDRSLTGHEVRSIAGVPLSKAVEQHGGPRYGQKQLEEGKQNFWASQLGAANSLQNKTAKAVQETGMDPYGLYVAMAPESSAYALHHTESLLNQLDALNPRKKDIEAFNKEIRQQHPAFFGLKDPEVMEQLRMNPEMRKLIAERLNKQSYYNELGLPSGEATIHAITEPRLRDVATGTTGFSVGKLDPHAKLSIDAEGLHPTYNTQIPGEFKGEMIAQLPWEFYFPEAAKQIASNPKQAPHAFGTFKMGQYHQPVTQELIDIIAPIEEQILKGHAEGGQIEGYAGGELVKKGLTTIAKPVVDRINMHYKDVTKRIPELQESAKKMLSGAGSREEHEALVNTFKPVKPFEFVPQPATREEAVNALHKDKKALYGVPSQTLQAGHPVGLRLDIPAYSDHGVWVPTIHEQASGFGAGKTIGHESVASVLNPAFGMSDKAALSIASGKPKGTIATIKGDWNPVDNEAAVARAQDYLNHPEWVQVGMDPERHGYFYNRATMEPITHAEEALQIGPLVLAKKPVYGKKEDFKFADGGLACLKEGGHATPAWQRKEGKNPNGGLNAKGRASYNRETGGNLKRPQPEGGARRDSFCARMEGMKKKRTSAKTANDPDSRINKSLRAWNC